MTTVTKAVHFGRGAYGKRLARTTPLATLGAVPGRVPRVARLMALAIRLDAELRSGEARSLTELARRHQVSQPRMTQILNMTLLPPEVQEDILHLPNTVDGRDPVTEREIRTIAAEACWSRGNKMWLARRCGGPES